MGRREQLNRAVCMAGGSMPIGIYDPVKKSTKVPITVLTVAKAFVLFINKMIRNTMAA